MVSLYFFVGSHWKYWHIMTFDVHWFHLKVHGIDLYCQFIVAGHAWCLGFRGIEGITVEVVGKTWENYWLVGCFDCFIHEISECLPTKNLSYLVKLWISSYFPFDNQHDLGGGIARVHGYANDIQWLLFLKRWRQLDRVSRSFKKLQKSPHNHRFGCKKGPF